MANFLQSSMDAYQRGWQQRYGPRRQPGPMVVPVARNPAIGAPLGANEDNNKTPETHHPVITGEVYPNLEAGLARVRPGDQYPRIWSPESGTPEALQVLERQAQGAEGRTNDALNAYFKDYVLQGTPLGPIHNVIESILSGGRPRVDPRAQYEQALQEQRNTPLEPGYRGTDYGNLPGNIVAPAVPSPAPTPVANNPAMGQPIGAGDGTNPGLAGVAMMMALPFMMGQRGQQQPEQNTQQQTQPLPLAYNPEMGAPRGAPTAISKNPEVGQWDGSSDGGGGGNNWIQTFVQNLQRLFGGGNQSPTALAGNPTASQVGPPGPGQGQDWGINPNASPADIANAAATSTSADALTGSDASQAAAAGMGGGIGGTGMSASQLGGMVGSAISSWGKNQPNFKYVMDNIPLPQRATFAVPTLPPVQNPGF